MVKGLAAGIVTVLVLGMFCIASLPVPAWDFVSGADVLKQTKRNLPATSGIQESDMATQAIQLLKLKLEEHLSKSRQGKNATKYIRKQRELARTFARRREAANCTTAGTSELRDIASRLLPYFNARDSRRLPAIESWSFHICRDNQPNASATPDHDISFTTGFLRLARNQAEIAGVIAHEIAHLYLLHYGVLATAWDDKISFKMILSRLGVHFVSEMFEMEADYMAIMATGRAGYSPLATPMLLERIVVDEPPSDRNLDSLVELLDELFRSHPLTQCRLNAQRQAIVEFYTDRRSPMWNRYGGQPGAYYYVGKHRWSGEQNMLLGFLLKTRFASSGGFL